jgi:hypothetical protein
MFLLPRAKPLITLFPSSFLKFLIHQVSDDVACFVHYSLLSLALDGPILAEEFQAAVDFFHENPSIPDYLQPHITELLQFASDPPQCPTQPSFETPEASYSHIVSLASPFNFDSVFQIGPRNSVERNACKSLLQCLEGSSGDLLGLFMIATDDFSDFRCIFDFFESQRDVYIRFASFILALADVSYCKNFDNEIKLFNHLFRFPELREWFNGLVNEFISSFSELPVDHGFGSGFPSFLG